MQPIYERSTLVFGVDGIESLNNAHVLIAGIGGVGGFVAEALARAGVGHLTLVDHDRVSESNLNRQIIALHSTQDALKVDVMKSRIKDINPQCCVKTLPEFIQPDDMEDLLSHGYDFVVDAIDSLNCKVALVKTACDLQIPVVSSMGAGRRVDPSKIVVGQLDKTHTCGLARNMRSRLKKYDYGKQVDVVFSTELPLPPGPMEEIVGARGRVINGTASYMPGIFGLMLSGLVINRIVESGAYTK